MSRSGVAVVGLIGMCGGVVVLASSMSVEQEAARASQGVQREVIRAMTAACPELSSGKDRQTWLTMASIPGLPGQQDSGSFTLTLDGEKKPTSTVSQVGETTEAKDFPTRPTHATVTALEGLAPGSVAGRTSDNRDGEQQGLSSAECTQPSSRMWLVGGGTTTGQRDRLILVNPTDSDTVVDLDIFGTDGQVDATGTDGVTVKAHDRREIQLDAIVSGVEALAIRVETRVGLISGFIVDDRMQDLTPRGTEIIAEAGSPTKRSVIAGLPAGPGERQIVLFAPREGGSVRLRGLTADGPVDLADGQEIEMRPGRVRVVDLTKELDGQAASIEAIGDMPILLTANMRTSESSQDSTARQAAVAEAESALKKAKSAAEKAKATRALSDVRKANADPGSDIVWLSARPRLTHSGVATAILPHTKATVSVVALDGDVDVKVSILAGGQDSGELRLEREVTVAADTSREIQLKSGSESSYSVVVERAAGPGRLFASHRQTGPGKAVTGYSLGRLSPRVAVPAARPVYGAPN